MNHQLNRLLTSQLHLPNLGRSERLALGRNARQQRSSHDSLNDAIPFSEKLGGYGIGVNP